MYCKGYDANTNGDMTIHVNDIYKMQNDKETLRLKTYTKILNKCYAKVRHTVNRNEHSCLYNVPDFLPGVPVYEVKHCIRFLIIRLTANGFNCKYIQPNIIFISWKQTKIPQSQYVQIKYQTEPNAYYRAGRPKIPQLTNYPEIHQPSLITYGTLPQQDPQLPPKKNIKQQAVTHIKDDDDFALTIRGAETKSSQLFGNYIPLKKSKIQ
jgi:hypothetical protein